MLRPIETRADLLRFASQHGYVDRATLTASGLVSMGAVAAELRRAGYGVVFAQDRDRLVITRYPHETAKLNAADQTRLFDMAPTRERQRGFGDSDS